MLPSHTSVKASDLTSWMLERSDGLDFA